MSQVSSIFSQLLHLVPRPLFDKAVGKHNGMRHARGFSRWDQFVSMPFCQLGQAHSVQEIKAGLQDLPGQTRSPWYGPSPKPLNASLRQPAPELDKLLDALSLAA